MRCQTALFIAIKEAIETGKDCYIEIIDQLLDKGTKVLSVRGFLNFPKFPELDDNCYRDRNGRSTPDVNVCALNMAVEAKRHDIVERLVRFGVEHTWFDAERAVSLDSAEILRIFLKTGINFNQRGLDYDGLLCTAGYLGCEKTLDLLLRFGISPNQFCSGFEWPDPYKGLTLIQVALKQDFITIAKALLEAGGDIEKLENNQLKKLLEAYDCGEVNIENPQLAKARLMVIVKKIAQERVNEEKNIKIHLLSIPLLFSKRAWA